MIRINLLPGGKGKSRSAAPADPNTTFWVALYSALFVFTVIGLGIWYTIAYQGVSEQLASNERLRGQIATVTRSSANIDVVRAALERSRQLEAVVEELQRARLGPKHVLMELVRVTSEGGGPTVDTARLEALRRTNPLAGYNPNWDYRRVWLTEFTEDNREVVIKGVARTNEDVGEFQRRLTLSERFSNVVLTSTAARVDTGTSLDVVDFELHAQVRY